MATASVSPESSDDKVELLECEIKKLHDEFNIQRAKLKELFLQKESECVILKKELEEMKSQFLVAECNKDNEIQLIDRKAQEEISSLQHIVQETIEESTIFKIDLEKLIEENNQVKLENQKLKEEILERQESSSLAPVFSHVKKSLTKRFAGDSYPGYCAKDENINDPTQKIDKYAKEDAEVLRSLVVPLEEEIKALKEKLRTTDNELQLRRCMVESPKASKNREPEINNKINRNENIFSSVNVNKSISVQFNCQNCEEKEKETLKFQEINKSNEEKILSLQNFLLKTKEELAKEAALRKDLEKQWQEKREIHKEEVLDLNKQIKKSNTDLINVSQQFFNLKEEINRQLNRVTEDRENLNKHLEILQSDNDYLSGKYLASSEELENQSINLPNNIEDLHILVLQLQSDLLLARVGVEFEKRRNLAFIDENNILIEQIKLVSQERESEKNKVRNQIKSLEFRLREVLVKGENNEQIKENAEKKISEMSKNMSELRVQILELQSSNAKLKKINDDLKVKVINLQEDLKTSEHVQKDFVKLSQSLQIALEGIRQAENQVRWQDDEDVEKCPNCSVMFTVTCRKQHCRHCGKIFCEKCLTKSVSSGPRQKLARVCDICHTVLTPNTAPYFSEDPPHSSL